MKFTFKGGIHKAEHKLEKFMLFLLLDGREILFYKALKNKFITSTIEKFIYDLPENMIIKIFMSIRGFGYRNLRQSFFIKTSSAANKEIIIQSFSGPNVGIFKIQGTLLQKSKAKYYINNESTLKCIAKEPLFSIEQYKKIISIKKIGGCRKIYVQKRGNSE